MKSKRDEGRINRAPVLSGLISLLLLLVASCASGPPMELIARNDHRGLADWYQQEAIRLRSKADEMRLMAREYDSPLFQPSPKETKAELIAHCERFVRYYTNAAEEADALASLHRRKGMTSP